MTPTLLNPITGGAVEADAFCSTCLCGYEIDGTSLNSESDRTRGNVQTL